MYDNAFGVKRMKNYRSSETERTTRLSDLDYAPPSFTNEAGEKIVFVDFTEAVYRLEFDAQSRIARVFSTVVFECNSPGFPAFSLRQPVTAITLDGEAVELREEQTPGYHARFKSVSKSVTVGTHILSITSALTELGPNWHEPVRWYSNPNRLHCLFDMTDLDIDGGYLEAYLPSNYDYDHFKITFRVKIVNSPAEYSFFTNGTVKDIGPADWEIQFPSFFTTSSPWFNFGPKNEYISLRSTFVSLDRRTIPVLSYTTVWLAQDGVELEPFREEADLSLKALESDFGEFPHSSVTIFATGMGRGGMEYAGATTTGLGSLRHELNHSYFARSVMPVNGDAGWVDEAIASWADAGYPRSPTPPSDSDNMGNRSPYIRTTSRSAYTIGQDFLSYLDHVLRDQGGLKKMLAVYAEQKRYTSVSAKEFQLMAEQFFGSSLQVLFCRYVYGEAVSGPFLLEKPTKMENPHKVPKEKLFECAFPPGQLKGTPFK